jgi:hypothetical protein
MTLNLEFLIIIYCIITIKLVASPGTTVPLKKHWFRPAAPGLHHTAWIVPLAISELRRLWRI